MEQGKESGTIVSQVFLDAFDVVDRLPNDLQKESVYRELGNRFLAAAQTLRTDRERLATEGGRVENDTEAEVTRALLLNAVRDDSSIGGNRPTIAAAEIRRRQCSHGAPNQKGR